MAAFKVKATDLDVKLDPELKPFFSKFPEIIFTRETLPQTRILGATMFKTFAGPKPENVTVIKKKIPGPKNSPEVGVLIYKSKVSSNQKLPGVLFIHGGGFITGTAEQASGFVYKLVEDLNTVVVSVEYRLAPENPFPAGLEDCYAALVWMNSAAEELGIDVNRIVVIGGSAGGGLCVGVSLLARDRGGPKIYFQMPLYPMLDDRNNTVSSHQILDRRAWNRELNIQAWKWYLGDNYGKDVSHFAAPARTTDFSGLPPTFTYVGELDLFRDETIEFVAMLQRAEVPVEFHIFPRCFHGFEIFIPTAEISKRAVEMALNSLKRGLNEEKRNQRNFT